jgi:hypothetical protein
MRRTQIIIRLLALYLAVVVPIAVRAQSTDELKKCVGFVFGRVHAKGPDGVLVKDAHGNPVLLDMPLGTAFFVYYGDKRGGNDYGFVHVVTAKHVLKDVGRKLSKRGEAEAQP